MAGAGRKTFIAGEVLTAAQVNDFLMDQAVMRFSGSAARAASLTPTEGMVTYLDDANALEVYDGSAWIPADLRRLITGSAQVLIGVSSGSVIAIGGAEEGQVLTAASAQPGGLAWQTPSGAGAAVYKFISASGTTGLPAPLTPGFYKISYGTATLNQTQFRFVDTEGNYYGASITSGVGFATIPVEVASLNTTTGGNTLLVEEIAGVTATLPIGPTLTEMGWTSLNTASLGFTTSGSPTQIGYFNPFSGSLIASSVVTSPLSGASVGASTIPIGGSQRIAFVQQNADGLWSTSASAWSSSAFNAAYPYAVYTSNGTYTPPSWSTSADVFIVSGGGAGGGATSGNGGGGGGGAGGASLFTNFATPASVSVTVGLGGTGGTGTGPSGGASSFGSASVAGGGGGGTFNAPAANGGAGGSGGGGGGRFSSPPSTGTGGSATPSGLGFAGGNGYGSNPDFRGGGGGGGGYAAVGTNSSFDAVSPGGSGSVYLGVFPFGGGGGGGADMNLGFGSPGGSGGGGNGQWKRSVLGPTVGPAATPGTNGMGGGGGGSATTTAAGSGGSGIIIVKAK